MVAESTGPIVIADKLLDALSETDRPGDFCVSGDLPMTMPGLEVDSLGPVSLPLNRTQAKKLIQCCRQAPYGQGSDTIVDTDVRRVWELDPQQFQLTGPEWDSMVTAITLQHRYTKGGLKRDALKGTDRNWADVVFAAAERADCCAYLAQLTRFQNGMPSNWYELEQRARGHFVSGSWDEEKDGPYRGKASYEDIYEESLSLDGWSDCDGKAVRFGQIDLNEKEVIADPPFSKWSPSREEIEGYTGNEGVTAKRWYHRAAIVVWPRDKQYSVLCDAGTAAAIGGLEQMTSQLDRGSKSGRSERLLSRG